MRIVRWSSVRAAPVRFGAAVLIALALNASATAQGPRPMTFMDVQDMRSFGSEAPSPDGRWLLYTVTTPDWKTAKEQSDVYLVSLAEGVTSSRQMTFTKEYNETSPQWSRDGRFFAFLSNRDAPAGAARQNQVYVLRPDGGDARRITDAKDGVADFAFSRDGRWLVYRAGKSEEQQLYRLAVAAIASGEATAEQLTRQPAGVGRWQIAPDSRRIYFIAPDSVDQDEKRRLEADFTVTVYHMEKPLESLWALDLDPVTATRLTRDPAYSVTSFTVSNDSRWVGFRGVSSDRFKRTRGGMVMGGESNLYTELYLLDAATGQIEQITRAEEIGKGGPYFSPDSRWVAFTAPRDLTRYTRGLTQRVYLRPVGQRGGEFRRVGDTYDGDVGLDFWSLDGNTIYFNDGVRTTEQLLALDVGRGTVRQITNQDAGLRVERDPETGVVLINYSNSSTPATLYTVGSVDQVPNRSTWRQLTDVNPQVRGFALGAQEEITWRSTDGKQVGGVITYPVGYQRGQRYPLIVWIHGGPSAADVNRFNASSQVYAGDGYVVLRPNYRGSRNYGEAFENINGNYFPQGFDDIMAGVDHLIAQGIVDGNRMGAMGWSAGGHWSNWILTHTDRFKAISTGAGAMNWISMYAQNDGQRHRQEYFGGKLPYHDFDAYWNQSPLKYILNAKTPTMIHVVKGDPRVPAPQSAELFMALKQLGVPTEFFMYPGDTHGIPDARNRMVKAMAEKAWMDHYVRGIGERFAWADVRRELLKTLGEAGERRPVTSDRSSGER
ncbi:MAG TPA: S9 family peptidase [Gemmatimonadales bacterium]|nr:S9 family peptidase [Gemmatimonadales bacterium]